MTTEETNAVEPLVQKKPTRQDQQKNRFYQLLEEDKIRRLTEELRRKER